MHDKTWSLLILASTGLCFVGGWLNIAWLVIAAGFAQCILLFAPRKLLVTRSIDSRVAAMMQESLAASLFVDRDHRVIWCNASLRRLLATDTDREEAVVAISTPMQDLFAEIPGHIGDALEDACNSCPRDTTLVVDIAENSIDALILQAHVTTTSSADESLAQVYMITLLDVTTERRCRDDVSVSRAMAEREAQANLAKTDVMQMLSHELRTPLQGILGVASVSCVLS